MSFTYHHRRKVRNTAPLKQTHVGLPQDTLGFISACLIQILSTSTFGISKGTNQALPALKLSKNLPPIISVRLPTYQPFVATQYIYNSHVISYMIEL